MYDYCFNVFNSVSAQYFKNVTLSPELTVQELKPLAGDGTEIVAYGHIVLMSTHQCPAGTATGHKNGRFCSEKGSSSRFFLKDRTGAMLPVMTHCRSCTAFILNNTPLYLAHKWQDMTSTGTEFLRLDFTVEDGRQTAQIMALYARAVKEGCAPLPDFGHTGGHYFRRIQ